MNRAQIVAADRVNLLPEDKKQGAVMVGRVRDTVSFRNGPPFIAAHDIARGLIHAVQSALHFAIMLALM